MASPAKQPPGSSVTCESLIRTRRMNKTESFLLEERLKVLDSKKNQKYAELNVEKDSLKKEIQEIRSVRKNSGISAERRKLLRSQGYITGTRTALNDSDDAPAAFKRFSVPDISCSDLSASRSPKLNTHKSEPVMKAFSQINIHGLGEAAESREITSEGQRKNSSVTTRSRARHQFRVIEPPCRPGSRRNFVQLSNDKLKDFNEKEEKESAESLFDHNTRLDHRGVILPSRLAKTSKNTTQAEVKADESPGQTHLIPISEKQICQDKLKKTTQSDQVLFSPGKQAWAENLCFENKTRTKENSSFRAVEQKPRSNSCDGVDRLTEVCASDSPSDFHDNESISRDVITSGSPLADRKLIIANNKVHSTSELRRIQASTRPLAPVAFVESQEGMPDIEKQSHVCVIESRQPKVQHVRNVETESRNSRLRADSSESNANEQTQLPREKPAELWKNRRFTLPPGKLSIAPPDKELALSHDGGKSEPKKLRAASLSPDVRKNSVTYAYDARPGRSLCKGYVTMQMTVKGKQVKVHIPKFPHDSESEPVIERLRKKISIDRSQPRALQEKEILNKDEKAEA